VQLIARNKTVQAAGFHATNSGSNARHNIAYNAASGAEIGNRRI